MIVKNKKSRKRKNIFYKAIEFYFDEPSKPIKEFIGKSGKIVFGDDTMNSLIAPFDYIKLNDGSRICPNQILIKDRKGKIYSYDITTFFDIWLIWER